MSICFLSIYPFLVKAVCLQNFSYLRDPVVFGSTRAPGMTAGLYGPWHVAAATSSDIMAHDFAMITSLHSFSGVSPGMGEETTADQCLREGTSVSQAMWTACHGTLL